MQFTRANYIQWVLWHVYNAKSGLSNWIERYYIFFRWVQVWGGDMFLGGMQIYKIIQQENLILKEFRSRIVVMQWPREVVEASWPAEVI
jgi:hypothetical protein